MKRIASSLLFPVCLLLVGCELLDPEPEPEQGASSFQITGTALFTGSVIAPVKMALFYTGELLYADDRTFPAGATAALVSNVIDLGREPIIETPFTLDADLRGYTGSSATATLIMWVDLNEDDTLDVGEKTSRVLPNLETGCPVFGSASAVVPVHYVHDSRGDGFSGIAEGWNQSRGASYVPAGDGTGADIENEINFTLAP